MFIRRRRRRAAAPGTETEEVPMTPMIDIVFQLLIFFMLTMSFKEVEGKLLSQLPKIGTGTGESIPREEVRIVICAGGDVARHTTHKGDHDRTPKDGAECVILVERHEIGRIRKTAEASGELAENRRTYRQTAARAGELLEMVRQNTTKPGKTALILDADSEVPYEHVIGVVNALKEEGINDVEFAANPRHAKTAR